MLHIQNFSKNYQIKQLTEVDLDEMLLFCQENATYYHYHPAQVTKELLKKGLFDIPQNKSYEDKYFVGYYEKDILIALLDLIDHFPQDHEAYIGFFMMNMAYKGSGRGTAIIDELINYLRKTGYQKIRLGIDKGNPQSEAFWTKHQFKKNRRRSPRWYIYLFTNGIVFIKKSVKKNSSYRVLYSFFCFFINKIFEKVSLVSYFDRIIS